MDTSPQPRTPGAPEQAGRAHVARQSLERERWRLLRRLDRVTQQPLTALSFVWIALLVVDFTRGLSPAMDALVYVIWAIFVMDFVVEMLIAPDRLAHLKRNWLTMLSLALPALRVLRIFRAARVLRLFRAARAGRSLSLLRLLTSINRGMGALGRTLARRGAGYVLAVTLLVLFAGAAGMRHFESPESLREAGFPDAPGLASYGHALWWTAMLLTTVGSEYWPLTAEGRVLCLLLSVYALSFFGYLAATLASHFLGRDQEDAPPNPDLVALQQEIRALRNELRPTSAPEDRAA